MIEYFFLIFFILIFLMSIVLQFDFVVFSSSFYDFGQWIGKRKLFDEFRTWFLNDQVSYFQKENNFQNICYDMNNSFPKVWFGRNSVFGVFRFLKIKWCNAWFSTFIQYVMTLKCKGIRTFGRGFSLFIDLEKKRYCLKWAKKSLNFLKDPKKRRSIQLFQYKN